MQSKYVKDVTGNRYGRWTVVSFSGVNERKKSTWNCVCDCGVERVVSLVSLTQGTSKSCGCMVADMASSRFKTHGKSNTKLHEAWRHMMRRCYNEKHKYYKDYGGRGIYVCERWKDFENFYQDNIEYVNSNLTLDRADNELGYSKENCRWVDMKAQNNNRRSSVFLEYRGVQKTLKQWAEHFGVKYQTFYWRVKQGFSIEVAGGAI